MHGNYAFCYFIQIPEEMLLSEKYLVIMKNIKHSEKNERKKNNHALQNSDLPDHLLMHLPAKGFQMVTR